MLHPRQWLGNGAAGLASSSFTLQQFAVSFAKAAHLANIALSLLTEAGAQLWLRGDPA